MTVAVVHTISVPQDRHLSAVRSRARDLHDGMVNWRLWSMLGWNDIRQRYRRSALGPFWITISMAIFVVLLGVIYSKLFHQNSRCSCPISPWA